MGRGPAADALLRRSALIANLSPSGASGCARRSRRPANAGPSSKPRCRGMTTVTGSRCHRHLSATMSADRLDREGRRWDRWTHVRRWWPPRASCRAACERPDDCGRHRPRSGDHGDSQPRRPLELIPRSRCPAAGGRPGPGRPRLVAAVRYDGAVLARVEAQAVLGFGGYVSTPPTWPHDGSACRSCCTSRTSCRGWPTGGGPAAPGTSSPRSPPTPLPNATCIGLPMRRSITELDRTALRGTGAGSVRTPADGDVVGQRRLAGCREHQPSGAAGRGPRCWPRHLGAARARRQEHHQRGRRVVDPDTGAVYAPVA